MSSEQQVGDRVIDARRDAYSLDAVLYRRGDSVLAAGVTPDAEVAAVPEQFLFAGR